MIYDKESMSVRMVQKYNVEFLPICNSESTLKVCMQ